MGPDEDHPNVDNNGFTNAAAKLAIRQKHRRESRHLKCVRTLRYDKVQGYPGNFGSLACVDVGHLSGGWRLLMDWSSNTTGFFSQFISEVLRPDQSRNTLEK